MNLITASLDRRRFLRGSLALGAGVAAFFTVRGVYAEELRRTPPMTEIPSASRKSRSTSRARRR